MSYGLRPDWCTCFENGYCFKSLGCRSKPEVEKAAKELRDFKREKRDNKPITQTWRADGSHELGPIPQGRIPKIEETKNGTRRKKTY
jgi:hypothetical protein